MAWSWPGRSQAGAGADNESTLLHEDVIQDVSSGRIQSQNCHSGLYRYICVNPALYRITAHHSHVASWSTAAARHDKTRRSFQPAWLIRYLTPHQGP